TLPPRSSIIRRTRPAQAFHSEEGSGAESLCLPSPLTNLYFWGLQNPPMAPRQPQPQSAYLLPLAGMISFFRLSPLAAIARLRSRSFSNILIFSEKLSEASLFRIGSLLTSSSKIPVLKPLPL